MDIQLPQILFQMINFGVVAGALTVLLYKPILKLFEERSKKIEAGQKAAEENLAEREKIEKHQHKVKQEAEKEAALILDEARSKAEKLRKELVAAAKTEAAAEISEMKQEWQAQHAQQVKAERAQIVEAAIAGAARLINEKLDNKKHAALIDDEITAVLKAL